VNININDGERYVPELYGNAKDEKPMAFNLQFLSVEESDLQDYYEVTSAGKGKARTRANYSEVFRRGVKSIENCFVNGKEIVSSEEFLTMVRGSPKLAQIKTDVALHIMEGAEVPEKNS
jgi:hypothetical protein